MQIIFNRFFYYTLDELKQHLNQLNISILTNSKQYILSEILRYYVMQSYNVIYSGYLEILQNSTYGILRSEHNNFMPAQYDCYISVKLIKEFDLRPGDYITCVLFHGLKDDQKLVSAESVILINGVEYNAHRKIFDELTPIYPTERITLDTGENTKYDQCARIMELVIPIGFGQRSLIISPPKSGKTTMVHTIATGISHNYVSTTNRILVIQQDIYSHYQVSDYIAYNHILIILLICERPEEVNEMKRKVPNAMIISSTFDEPDKNHIRVAEFTIEIAKRLVEEGRKVIVILDSITRLVRAYNNTVSHSGRTLSGGIESSALYQPKKFFGAARNTIESGSLTIIATALEDTGSRMDDFIKEELMGTGNSDCYLCRKLAERKLFPAINIKSSSTRRFEDMMLADQTDKFTSLSYFLSNKDSEEGLRFLIKQVTTTRNNDILFAKMYSNN